MSRSLQPLVLLVILFFSGNDFAASKIRTSLWPCPQTKKSTLIDDYHGVKVADPYRWLEDSRDPEVKDWIEAQNKLTSSYLEKIPYRQAICARLQQLYDYSSYAAPFKAGEYYFYSRDDGKQKENVHYFQKDLEGEARVFIDPNALSKDRAIKITLCAVSLDNKYIAVSRRKSGSEMGELRVLEISNRQELADRLFGVKSADVAWDKEGFFYSHCLVIKKNGKLSTEIGNQKLCYHRLGTAQESDRLIYEDAAKPARHFVVALTGDRRYLIVSVAESAKRIEILYRELQGSDPGFKVLCPGFAWDYKVIDASAGKFLVYTNADAPNYRIVAIDPRRPQKENWQEVVKENDHVLAAASTAGGKLFGNYLQDASSHIYQYSLTGTFEREVILPAIGVASGFSGAQDDASVFYTFTSFTYPPAIYHYEIGSAKSKPFCKSDLAFDPAAYETKQIFYPGKDGTKVPMFLVYKKDLPMDGKRPTYLYGYGGFNSILKPDFVAANIVLLERGGIFAQANIRGGGEYGVKWHRAGILENKQNAIDDFIAAAEFLILAGYTSKDRLAIAGGSNGGLLVAACITQRPELFKVALPAAGVMDMLRYHKFTQGRSWVGEYGSSDDPLQFKYLYAYSPLHNIKAGVSYPATLVSASVHDPVVVPAHSYKFVAALQEYNRGPNPVLIRIATSPNRGPDSLDKKLDAMADIWAFMFQNTGGL
jgi:prolyl oligopeptidase